MKNDVVYDGILSPDDSMVSQQAKQDSVYLTVVDIHSDHKYRKRRTSVGWFRRWTHRQQEDPTTVDCEADNVSQSPHQTHAC